MTALAPPPSASPPIGALSPSLKRRRSDAEFEDPSKRLRVTFNEEIDVRVFDKDDDSKPYEFILDEVTRGIAAHLAAPPDDTIYDQLIDLFRQTPTRQDAPSTTKIRKHLQAIMHNVSSLTRDCSGLVYAVLDMAWLGRDEAFVILFRQFLGLLLSAHGSFTVNTFRMLTGHFRGKPPTKGQFLPGSEISKAVIDRRLHSTIKYLLRMSPSALTILSRIIAKMYPASDESRKMHINFANHALLLAEYVPELKSEILSTITDRLVKVDVEVQVEIDKRDDDDIEESEILAEIPDDEDEELDDDDDDLLDMGLTEDEERRKTLRESIGKIDAVMDILFSYYQGQMEPSEDEKPNSKADDAVDALLSQFASTILPRHRSRHTQFILFHICQQNPKFADQFAGAATHLTSDTSRTSLVRTNAADYLASFVARGKRVAPTLVQEVLKMLLDQADDMRALHERNSPIRTIRPDRTRYGLYYACVQALLYIFCFRWRDFVQNAEDLVSSIPSEKASDLTAYPEPLENFADAFIWVPDMKHRLSSHIYSVLNPLKVCAPGIVNQFAHIARATKFLYVYPLIEANKRVRLQLGGLSFGFAGADGGGRLGAAKEGVAGSDKGKQLEAYFPFDPYILPKSKRWLDGDYLDWNDVALAEDKVEDDESEDEAEEQVDVKKRSDSEDEHGKYVMSDNEVKIEVDR
ncbi:MAG: hypothetical protein M1820_006765 [Bogoriella megaspora]|nr:MAG: hypothetical protein M1820_006765 [Bogoriella megaspora]